MSTFVYIYIIIVLIKRYSADEITRNVCFKTASELVKNLNKCRFSLKSVVDLMQDRGTTCRSKCDVRMNNIESRMIPWKALFLRSAAFHTNLKLVWGRETTEYILSSTAHHQKMMDSRFGIHKTAEKRMHNVSN
nr:uncharacterized protein LOC105331977 isoform X1 [Crassostrea gigas]